MTHSPNPARKPSPTHTNEHGQGWLEYAIVGVLVFIILASLWGLFRHDFQKWVEENRAVPTPTLPAPQVIQEGVFAEIIETETISATNCIQGDTLTVPVERIRSVEHRIVLNNSRLEPELALQLIDLLEGFYGFSDGEIVEETYTFDLPVQPGQQLNRLVEWQYLWDEGEVTIYNADGTASSYDYRARVELEYNEIGTHEAPTVCEP